MIRIEEGPEREPAQCPCCESVNHWAHGFIYSDERAHAVYLASWNTPPPLPFTEATPERPKNVRNLQIVLSLGEWGEDADAATRFSVALEVLTASDHEEFMILEPEQSSHEDKQDILGQMLGRDEALQHAQAEHFIHLAECVTREDTRVRTALAHLEPDVLDEGVILI